MDSYSANAHGQIQPQRPPGIDSEEEHHVEKKSVMTMVKDKAKKMKNTINQKARDYGHSHEEHTSSKEEEEEEEEMKADPDVHENVGPGSVSPVTSIGRTEEDPAAPNGRTSAPSDQTQRISSPSTGSDVVGESPISHSFQNMVVSDEGQGEKEALKSPPTGTHDNQFSPENLSRLKEDKLPKESNQVDEKEIEALNSPPTAPHDNKFSPENPPHLTEDEPKEPSQVDEKEKEALKSPPTGTYDNQFSSENPSRLMENKPKEPIQVDEKEKAQTNIGKLSSTGPAITTETDKGTETEKPRPGALSESISDLYAKEHGAVESHTAVAEAEAEGGGGVGMVGKMKGMVTSFLGAGAVKGNGTAPAAADEQVRGGPAQEV